MLRALALLACSQHPPGPPSGDDSTPPHDSVPVEHVGGADTSDDWIFSWSTIHTIDLTVPADGYASLVKDPYTAVEGSVSFDATAPMTVGVRLRGKVGAFEPIDEKPKLRIDWNAFVDGQRFYGLEALMLNNAVVDPSFLKEPLAYEVLRQAGVPSSRTGFAHVALNGADYGLYVVVEEQDDRFLKRTYADDDGNLYDGKYITDKKGHHARIDFALGLDDEFQLEEGTDVGHADITAISNAVLSASADFQSDLDPLVDWEEIHREWAAEWFAGQNDGYVLNENNYRVYFEPADGRADLIATDLDYAFIHDQDWGVVPYDWNDPRGVLAVGCHADGACTADQQAAIDALVSTLGTTDWDETITSLAAVIETEVDADPKYPFTTAAWYAGVATLQSWFADQPGSTLEMWGK